MSAPPESALPLFERLGLAILRRTPARAPVAAADDPIPVLLMANGDDAGFQIKGHGSGCSLLNWSLLYWRKRPLSPHRSVFGEGTTFSVTLPLAVPRS